MACTKARLLYVRKWRAEHVSHVKQYRKIYNKRNRIKTNAQATARRLRERMLLQNAYGNKCACCGETNPEFLTLDHKRNNGAAHRKSLRGNKRRNGGGSTFWRWLRFRKYPKDNYQLLCYNCNCAKEFSVAKVCPHTLNKSTENA